MEKVFFNFINSQASFINNKGTVLSAVVGGTGADSSKASFINSEVSFINNTNNDAANADMKGAIVNK